MNEHIKLVYTVEQMITREIAERKVFYQKSKADVQLFLDWALATEPHPKAIYNF